MSAIYTQYYKSYYGDDVYKRLERPPRFVPEHRVVGSRTRNGKREENWIEPDSVSGYQFSTSVIKRGAVDAIRVTTDPNVLAVFAEIDAERARLNAALLELRRREHKAIIGTFNCSKPVKVADLKTLAETIAAEKGVTP